MIIECLYVYLLDEHKHIVSMTQFPLSDTQNPQHKHSVGMIQFPSF
jgi:hypothetical protein